VKEKVGSIVVLHCNPISFCVFILLISDKIPRSNIIEQPILQDDVEYSSKTNWRGMVPPTYTPQSARRVELYFSYHIWNPTHSFLKAFLGRNWIYPVLFFFRNKFVIEDGYQFTNLIEYALSCFWNH